MHSFIQVHLGETFYGYIVASVRQIQKFNACPIYLVISKKHHAAVDALGVNLVFTEDLPHSMKHHIFDQTTTLNSDFRGNFCRFASERFFYIEEVMFKYQLNNVFHLENDNLLYCDVAESLPVFQQHYPIAAPFDNDARCIPGFMYFQHIDALSQLTYFMIEHIGPNDMTIIPMFRKQHGLVQPLPVIPPDYAPPLRSTTGRTASTPGDYASHATDFHALFDAAAIRQYLGGVDPRNDPGDTVGFINEDALYQADRFSYVCQDDAAGRKIPYAVYNNHPYRLNNLHIHSKKLEHFLS